MIEVERIKDLARYRGVKYSEIATELGLNANFLNDVNAGKCKLSGARLEKIADYLDTTVEYLRGETDEKNKPTPKVESELTVDTNELNLIVQFYKCFSDEGQKELMEKAFDIWQKEHSNNP